MANFFPYQNPDGTYSVVFQDDNGQQTRIFSSADQGEMERKFNDMTGRSNTQSEPARSSTTVSMPGANSMQMVGGLEQLALQIPQLQQEYQRQRLQEMELPVAQATLSGYLPKAWSQAQQGGRVQASSGTYNTANGPKTLQQMRDEIVAASRA